jgi:hypothetical protein
MTIAWSFATCPGPAGGATERFRKYLFRRALVLAGVPAICFGFGEWMHHNVNNNNKPNNDNNANHNVCHK